MNYHLRSFKTKSYWVYAFWSTDSLKTFVAVVAGIWTFVDILDSFKCLDKKTLSLHWLVPLFLIGIIAVIFTRRPVKKIRYKSPSHDLIIEVCIGDLFKIPGQKIISTNTTFDTDISSGIISINSLQGQFTQKFYPGDLPKLDKEIELGLQGIPYTVITKKSGKTHRYEFGTTIKLKLADQYFYWFAMSDLNESNTATTTQMDVNKSLDGLWAFIETKGEKLDTVIPLIGSGLGRLTTSRKKLIALIAQSFINASEKRIFSNKLTIVVYPGDIEKSGLNLFEVKDLLGHYLS
ncbi:macro domain-containing protein [Parasediminibacterium sp. JCM 36343]|uniref:macro domain-containing protein n=1 Tax=Parasediminibacterium sp. JCM 36343 TaxID=3374279 RepID=UPI00397B448D